MDLLKRVLASIIRRLITGAALSALTVMVARGLLSIELRDEVMSWLSGGATEWIVTILMAAGSAALTWLDKRRTKLLLAAAKALPAGATDADVERKAQSAKL
jgi:hypothetical protein